jgi:hypothetical protein
MASQRGRNEGIRVLEEFVCQAIPGPGLTALGTDESQRGRGVNRGFRLLEEPRPESATPSPQEVGARITMELDTNKIDNAVLALLYLGLHDGARAWKGFDWDAMDRLHQQGYITDPRGKAKSVVFTEEGLVRARDLLEELFGKHG